VEYPRKRQRETVPAVPHRLLYRGAYPSTSGPPPTFVVHPHQ
jgi:hypothetical protein